jgi:uncharacterized Zn finger protein
MIATMTVILPVPLSLAARHPFRKPKDEFGRDFHSPALRELACKGNPEMKSIFAPTERDIRRFVGKQNFSKGQQSVRNGVIVGPVRQGMTLKAYCYGSLPEPYRVQVAFDDTSITTTRCSCSGDTSRDGKHLCEHVAALLLTWHMEPGTFTQMDDIDTILERQR